MIVYVLAGFIIMSLLRNESKSSTTGFHVKTRKLLEEFEGFTPVPLWDYKQWSIGYGTACGYNPNKKPAIKWNRDQAYNEALKIVNDHHEKLSRLIKVDLNINQWSALLSFSYNLGLANADNLVNNINKKNFIALEKQWKAYVNAGGKPLQSLVNRRKKEWQIFIS